MALETILLIAFCISILSTTICQGGRKYSRSSQFPFVQSDPQIKHIPVSEDQKNPFFSFRRPTLDDFIRETVSISCTMLSIVLMISRERDRYLLRS